MSVWMTVIALLALATRCEEPKTPQTDSKKPEVQTSVVQPNNSAPQKQDADKNSAGEQNASKEKTALEKQVNQPATTTQPVANQKTAQTPKVEEKKPEPSKDVVQTSKPPAETTEKSKEVPKEKEQKVDDSKTKTPEELKNQPTPPVITPPVTPEPKSREQPVSPEKPIVPSVDIQIKPDTKTSVQTSKEDLMAEEVVSKLSAGQQIVDAIVELISHVEEEIQEEEQGYEDAQNFLKNGPIKEKPDKGLAITKQLEKARPLVSAQPAVQTSSFSSVVSILLKVIVFLFCSVILLSAYYRLYLFKHKKAPFTAPNFAAPLFPPALNYEHEITVLCAKYANK